jgi:hypothetical protein
MPRHLTLFGIWLDYVFACAFLVLVLCSSFGLQWITGLLDTHTSFTVVQSFILLVLQHADNFLFTR